MTLVWLVLVHHALSVGISPGERHVTKADPIRIIQQDLIEQVKKDKVSLFSYIIIYDNVSLELLPAKYLTAHLQKRINPTHKEKQSKR